jgi:hypothetical protein
LQLGTLAALGLFFIIVIVNIMFFSFWIYQMFLEVKNKFRKKAEKLYLWVFLCGNKERLEEEKRMQLIEEENEILREQYMKIIDNLKKLQEDNVVVLNKQVIERCQVYLGDIRYLAAIGCTPDDGMNYRTLKRN